MSEQIRSPGYDYSMVDSREKALRLVDLGELIALPMLPALFGGDETDERNIVFVPPEIARRKEEVDERVLLPRIQAGAVLEYAVEPENDPVSFVPIALNLRAFSPEPVLYRWAIWQRSSV
ncbi:MAG: hypothetical protein JF588_09530 [Caulobacterales bacterium]|nr:hypothetical protein [Caulobacterales bacterium]